MIFNVKTLHFDNEEGIHTSSENDAFAKHLALIARFISYENWVHREQGVC